MLGSFAKMEKAGREAMGEEGMIPFACVEFEEQSDLRV